MGGSKKKYRNSNIKGDFPESGIRSYVYYNNGNIKTIKDYRKFLQGTNEYINKSYSYDVFDRVTSITISDSGNMNTILENHTYTYDTLNQLVQSSEASNGIQNYLMFYGYDGNGNEILEQKMEHVPTISETIQKEYDSNNQLTKVTARTGGTSGPIQYTQENTYNYDGKRISRTENGQTTFFYYQNGVLLYTTDENGNKKCQNIIGPKDNIIATIHYDNGQHAFFYNKDIETSVTNIVNESGNGVVSYQYNDYGTTAKCGDTDFYNEICYTSGVYDELTGLYYLNARYYSPEDQRFMSQDSYRGEQADYATWNLYAYCGENPINYVDPSGHMMGSVIVSAVAGFSLWNIGRYNHLSKEEKLFVAVIAGEAIGENKKSWEAVAHIIMNRVKDKKYEFKNYNSVTAIIKKGKQFSCYTYNSPQYVAAKKYLNKRKPKNEKYEKMIRTVIPIYRGRKKDFTKGALLYYSPKSMEPAHSKPDWKFNELKEVKIKGISSESYRFFKYKK